MSFGLYLLGFAVVIGGVAWALALMHVKAVYIVVGCVILLGAAIVSGVAKTRQKDAQS